jgi:hypothetical protein
VECGGQPTSAAQVVPSAGVRCDLLCDRAPFLGNYGKLQHADVSLLVHKNDGSQFGLVQRSDGALYLRNSVREIFDQASCFSKYRVTQKTGSFEKPNKN